MGFPPPVMTGSGSNLALVPPMPTRDDISVCFPSFSRHGPPQVLTSFVDGPWYSHLSKCSPHLFADQTTLHPPSPCLPRVGPAAAGEREGGTAEYWGCEGGREQVDEEPPAIVAVHYVWGRCTCELRTKASECRMGVRSQ